MSHMTGVALFLAGRQAIMVVWMNDALWICSGTGSIVQGIVM